MLFQYLEIVFLCWWVNDGDYLHHFCFPSYLGVDVNVKQNKIIYEHFTEVTWKIMESGMTTMIFLWPRGKTLGSAVLMAARFPRGKHLECPVHCIGTRTFSNLILI